MSPYLPRDSIAGKRHETDKHTRKKAKHKHISNLIWLILKNNFSGGSLFENFIVSFLLTFSSRFNYSDKSS